MLEVNESKLLHYAMHSVGENILFGESYGQPDVLLEAALTHLAFHKIETEQTYEFFHESDLGLNEVYTFVKSIFDEPGAFTAQSESIAKHLHSVSQHPNIKDGELFIGYFEHILWGDDVRNAVAIVKIDEKELFIDTQATADKMTLSGMDGINVKRINNMAVIIDMGADEQPIVLMKTKKKEDAVYWVEQFLKIKVADEAYFKTTLALTACKKYILKEENYTNKEKLGLLNKTLDYFRQEQEFEAEQYIDTIFETAGDVQKDVLIQTVKPYETEISYTALAKAEKAYKRKIKLDDHIEIQVNVRDVKQIDQLIEVGYDQTVHRKFYKIYFDEEK